MDIVKLLQTLKSCSDEDHTEHSVYTGSGLSQTDIDALQYRLNVKFPEDFKKFLELVGFVEVSDREIFGATKDFFQLEIETNRCRKEGLIPPDFVVIEYDLIEGCPVGFFSGKSDIVRYQHDSTVNIANNFLDYIDFAVEDVLEIRNSESKNLFVPEYGFLSNGKPNKKEIKYAGMIVSLVKYEGVSWNAVVKKLNVRKIPARTLEEWTVDAAKEVYKTWYDRY